MKRSVIVKVATLSFSTAVLMAAIIHGCAKPAPQANAPASASANAPEAAPEEPVFLGPTKAAVMVHPKSPASAQQKK
jgi:hypothetical protein